MRAAGVLFGRSTLVGLPFEALLDAEFDETVEAAFDGRTSIVPLLRYHAGEASAGLAEAHFERVGASKESADATWRVTFYPLVDHPEARRELVRLASYTQRHPHPIAEVTQSGSVRFVNDAAHRMLPELTELGMRHSFLSGLLDLSVTSDASASATRTVLLPDGRRFEQHVVRVPGGNLRVFAYDVTSASQAATELRNQIAQSETLRASVVYQRDMARTLMETLAEPVFVADARGQMQYANAAAQKLIGQTLSDMQGHSILNMVHPDDRAAARAHFESRDRVQQARYRLRLVNADGSDDRRTHLGRRAAPRRRLVCRVNRVVHRPDRAVRAPAARRDAEAVSTKVFWPNCPSR